MGAKKTKVKKGPKGKKARAKAKLEQVWGEHVDEEARQASKFRKGKSRLAPSSTETNATQQQKRHVKEKEVDPLSRNRRGLKTSFESFLERKDNLYQNEQAQKQQRQYNAHHKKHKRYNNTANDGSSDDDDDDSGSEDDDMMGGVDSNGGSLSYLLKRINGPKKSSSSNKYAAESDDDDSLVSNDADSDDGAGSVSSASSSSQESHSDSDDDMDMDDEEEDLDVDLPKRIAEDPYEAHFSKKPLPQLDSKDNTNLMPHLAKSAKVDTSSLLSSSTQVHLSGPILDSWESLTNALPDKTKPRQLWRAFGKGLQQHTRQVLSRNWNSVNRSALKRSQRARKSEDENDIGFSPLQQVLYPALSNYADVLISMESRQVSVFIFHSV